LLSRLREYQSLALTASLAIGNRIEKNKMMANRNKEFAWSKPVRVEKSDTVFASLIRVINRHPTCVSIVMRGQKIPRTKKIGAAMNIRFIA
jgi:hypothetical protein